MAQMEFRRQTPDKIGAQAGRNSSTGEGNCFEITRQIVTCWSRRFVRKLYTQ